MRIAIDLQCCQSGSRLGGIGRYSMSLVKAMLRQSRGHEFWVVLNSLLPEPVRAVQHELKDLIPPDRLRVIDLQGPVAESKFDNKFRNKAAKLVRAHFLRELQPDLVHVSSMVEGFYEDVVTSVDVLMSPEKVSATLYDLIPFVQQEIYLQDPATRDHYLSKVGELQRAGLLLSISEYSRREGVELLGRPDHSVVNMSSASDSFFRRIEISADAAAALRAKYGIRNKFLMYTSSFDQRKNQESLIKAFASLPATLRSDYQLVLAGNGWDGKYKLLHRAGAEAGLPTHEIIFPGHAPDEDLLGLYNLCSLFVFPSMREGFGLPILEAMSCGAPAIGSNATSIPEVIGMEEALFDPNDVSSIGRKIHQCLTDEAFYRRLLEHARTQARKFSWDRSAQVALDAMQEHLENLQPRARVKRGDGPGAAYMGTSTAAYRALIAGLSKLEGIREATAGDLRGVARSISTNLASVEGINRARLHQPSSLRIGWITTWNTRCGIATYTIPVMKAVPASHSIFAPFETDANLVAPDGDNVFRCWKAGGNDTLSELAQAIDAQEIDALIVQFNYGFYDTLALSDFLAKQATAGRAVVVILHSTQDPPPDILNRSLSQFKEGLSSCQLLVHSDDDVVRLKQLELEENVYLLPLGMHEDAPNQIRLPFLEGKTVIGTYGFALPNKGLVELVDAFAQLASEDEKLHLLMLNAEFPAPESTNLIRSLKERVTALRLESRVTMMNQYMSNDDSIGHLRCADLIVIPYQGSSESSSGSVRMSLAADRPVAVTPLKLFDDVRSAVLYLPGATVDEIAAGMRQLVADIKSDAPYIRDVLLGARSWVRAHGFSGVGRYLFSTILLRLEKPLKAATVR